MFIVTPLPRKHILELKTGSTKRLVPNVLCHWSVKRSIEILRQRLKITCYHVQNDVDQVTIRDESLSLYFLLPRILLHQL